MELEQILLYRVDNLDEQRGIWRTWDGQWKPVFDDIIPNGVSKDLPMGDSGIYKGGWFASCENLGTLFKWVSPEDMITLQKHGFKVTTWDVDIKDTKRLNDLETIFLKQKATLVGWFIMNGYSPDAAIMICRHKDKCERFMDGNIPDGDFKLVEVEKCANHGYPNYIRNEKK